MIMKIQTFTTLALSLLLLWATGCSTSGSGSDNGEMFSSGSIASGGTFSYSFQEEGTFNYYCGIHEPDMRGTITVNAGASSTNPDTVEMIGEQFVPGQLTVAPNTEVVWINRADMVHTVISGSPSNSSDRDGPY